MTTLQTLVSTKKRILYDGTQLAPHWIYREFEILGDAIVSFLGPADVNLDHLVDLEDVKRNAPIGSPLMLHFLAEWFIDSLEVGILLQHLFTSLIYEALLEKDISHLARKGNDIYYQNRKLSVSIATRSPVSVLMHTALNVETEGTPIPTSGLREMKIPPEGFASEILGRFALDWEGWKKARVKVLPR